MAGSPSKYALINAKLRAKISKILPDEMFSQLAKAPSLEAALALLRETPFAGLEPIYVETGDLKLAELELLRREIELHNDLRRYLRANSKSVVDALLSQFEIDNLKNAIRVYFDRNVRHRPVEANIHYVLDERILHAIPIDLIVKANSFEEIAGLCDGTPYAQIIRKYGPTVQSEESLFRLEIGFDLYYYRTLIGAINHLDRRDRATALRLIGVEIDLRNISRIIRFKSFYDLGLDAILTTIIPGGVSLDRGLIDELYRAQNVASVLQEFAQGKYPGLATLLSAQTSSSTSRLVLIQRILDEIRRHEVHRILGGYPFTIGIVLAYFVLKGEELKKIRMVLNAKLYGREQGWIESML